MPIVVCVLVFGVVSDMNPLGIKGTNSPKCLVKELRRFGDEKRVEKFVSVSCMQFTRNWPQLLGAWRDVPPVR